MRPFILGSCLAVAVTLAFCANLILEAKLSTRVELTLRAPRTAKDPHLPLDADRLARTFGTPLRPRAGAAPTRPLPLKLLGTLDEHAAAVMDASSGVCRTMRVGDLWHDIELVGVGHGRVTLRRDGLIEELGIGGTSTPPVAAAPSSFPISFSPGGASLRLARSDLERQLPELARRAMEGGRVVPAFEGSTMIGFRLHAVRPGSLYDELGLKNGDLLESVNGNSLSNPEVALGLMTGLRNQRHIALKVNRGGERLTWDLSLN